MNADLIREKLTSKYMEVIANAVLGSSVSSNGEWTNYRCKLSPGRKTHNVGVNFDKKRFKCFFCQKDGGVFDFVMGMENITFQESTNRVGLLIGMEPEKKIKKKTKFFQFPQFTDEEWVNAQAEMLAHASNTEPKEVIVVEDTEEIDEFEEWKRQNLKKSR